MFGGFFGAGGGGNPFGGGGFGGAYGTGGVFSHQYRVYPVVMIDKPHLENGDKIIMPPSALDMLAHLHISYPMLFELTNPKQPGRKTHSGVLEFIAEEGVVYLPYWMMQNLLLEEGTLINIKSATLPKGSFVKFQPQTKDFLDIANPKAVLETTLRHFSALTKGDTVRLNYNNKVFNLDVLETKPRDAISLIETDIMVDFAPPLDYVEPPRPAPAPPAAAPAAPAGGLVFGSSSAAAPAAARAKAKEAEEESDEEPKPKFIAFSGSGQRLDGKPPAGPSAAGAKTTSPSAPAGPKSTSPAAPLASGSGAAAAAALQRAASFGQRSNTPHLQFKKSKDDESEEDEEEEGKAKFKAFSGKGYSLKG